MPWPIIYFVHLVLSIVVLLIGRIFYLSLIKKGKIPKGRYQSVKTLVVLGSGGHTTEILQIVKNLNTNKYTPRIYVHADSDKISANKVHEIESENNDFQIIEISRSREVGQSYVTSVLTTLVSFKDSIKFLWNLRPDLVLCNGPGTCVPICIAIFLMEVIFLTETMIVFVESFCRVKTYSLSGIILYYVADHTIVQWPQLCENERRNVHLIK